MSDNRTQFQNSYEISPILLIQGVASTMPGGMLPIIAVLQSQDFSDGILTGPTGDIAYGNTFASFRVLPGGTLIQNQIGKYPFANQTVAANAIITQPLNISLEMHCPPRSPGYGHLQRQAILSNLQDTLTNHTAQGGWFAVATPAYLYNNLILTSLRDITGGETKNWQTTFQWDFEAPLITEDTSGNSTNSLMNVIQNFLKPSTPLGITPPWSGLQIVIGSPNSGATTTFIPASSNLNGAGAVQSTSSTGNTA